MLLELMYIYVRKDKYLIGSGKYNFLITGKEYVKKVRNF